MILPMLLSIALPAVLATSPLEIVCASTAQKGCCVICYRLTQGWRFVDPTLVEELSETMGSFCGCGEVEGRTGETRYPPYRRLSDLKLTEKANASRHRSNASRDSNVEPIATGYALPRCAYHGAGT